MNPVLIIKFLKDNWKIIAIIIVVIIVYFVVKKNWYKYRHLFETPSISPDAVTGYTKPSDIPTDRKTQLEGMAKSLYNDMYDTPYSGHNSDVYKAADVLSDVELIYLSQYYRRYLTRGNSLWLDISDDWFPFTDVSSIQAHLSKIGEK